MKTSFRTIRIFLLVCAFSGGFAASSRALEPDTPKSFIAAGFGIEQLTYREKIPDINLASSDTGMTNLVLYLEGRKVLHHFFFGAKGYIPLTTEESLESWNREGQFAQSNSLSYGWTRIDGHAGFLLHPLLRPYVGIGWGYEKQKRGSFVTTDPTEIIDQTSTEEVHFLGALLGLEGGIPLATHWSFSYLAEYLLPFYSETTNDNLPGWKFTDVNGYSYSFTGRLHYACSAAVMTTLQVSGGRLHWDGSDWMTIDNGRIKWPENDTDFVSGLLILSINF